LLFVDRSPQSHESSLAIFGIGGSIPANAFAWLIVEIELVIKKAVFDQFTVFAILPNHFLKYGTLFELSRCKRFAASTISHHMAVIALVP